MGARDLFAFDPAASHTVTLEMPLQFNLGAMEAAFRRRMLVVTSLTERLLSGLVSGSLRATASTRIRYGSVWRSETMVSL